jgi:nitrogen regulatory protein PII
MAKESLKLPFEVSYSDKPGTQRQKTMKRLAVIVKPVAVSEITSSLKEIGLDSTIYDVKRATKDKDKTTVSAGRGSTTVELEYSSRKIIATVVNSEDVPEVVKRMKNGLGGEKAVVMVSAVEDLIMI